MIIKTIESLMSRAAALISTNNTMSQFYIRIRTAREERGFFVSYLSQARLSCSRAVRARERSRISLSLSLLMEGDDADVDYTT